MSAAERVRVAIVPCSGIGKAHGTVSREAAYEVTEELRPDATELCALSLLVLGDEATRLRVAAGPVVTLDGCKLACAAKMVEKSGGAVARAFDVLEVFRRHRALKPRGIAQLNAAGLELAHVLAEEVAVVVDGLTRKGEGGGDDA